MASICPTAAWATIHRLLLKERHLSFYNIHTGETLHCCYFRNGSYCPDARESINHILRDHRIDAVKAIDPRLLDILQALAISLGQSDATYHVISGYRSPQTNAKLRRRSKKVASKSLHMQGRAIDVRLPKVSTRALWHAAIQLKSGGVGYYPTPKFVHIDTGRVRAW
jgi:uncharacterized protein YcbK (DUF882 family)